MNLKPLTVLLVEDDDVDVEAIQRAFRAERIANPVNVAKDGIEALEILRGDEHREPLPPPYVILLDLSMPRMNGIEFLEALRQDDSLRDSIVFVLTTSNADEDKVAAYSNHVAGYVVKGKAGESFPGLVTMLECYWRIVEMPGSP